MAIREGEEYRCKSCKGEVRVTKNGSSGEIGDAYGEATFGESTYGGEAPSHLICCSQTMEKLT